MTDALQALTEDARRLYSKWSPAAWESLCRGPAALLAQGLNGRAEAEPLLRAYLKLGREAVGLQYIDRRSFESDATFLAALWIDALPRLLPEAPAVDAGKLLEKAWNAGERLVREPAWLNRYLASRVAELDRADRFEAWLRESLTPVLQAPPPSTWKGPLSFVVLDAAGGDGFLPGRVHLAAPAIACVHHRREERRQIAIQLRPGGKSLSLGRTPCFGEFAPPPEELPSVKFDESRATVAGKKLVLPRFGSEFAHAVAPCGFIIASAKSSQRVWVIESP